jgi:hypothetical protein
VDRECQLNLIVTPGAWRASQAAGVMAAMTINLSGCSSFVQPVKNHAHLPVKLQEPSITG